MIKHAQFPNGTLIEKCTCDKCGVAAKVKQTTFRVRDAKRERRTKRAYVASLPGWGAVFVHQEQEGQGQAEPLGYLCPECLALVVPLFRGRADATM